jgi:anti-sigma regulatory factor (Ser/Thr protein kinase)
MTATANHVEPLGTFLHEAFFYDSDQDYVARAVPFIEAGLDRGEPVLVAVPACNLALIRPRFGRSSEALLRFAAMEDLGRNPSWIIPAWQQFAAPHAAAGRPARGIGEPIWASRSPAELVECGRHEALINVAFADIDGFTLLCPYDLSSLAPDIIDEAHRNHPAILHVSGSSACERYRADIPALLDSPLSPIPASAEVFEFTDAATGPIRRAAANLASAAGLSQERISDLVVAVSEAVANSVRHGGGSGRIALWREAGRFLCEVRDAGRLTDPLAGRVRPSIEQANGRGLWIINQLCDLVQVRAVPGGQVIRLHMTA